MKLKNYVCHYIVLRILLHVTHHVLRMQQHTHTYKKCTVNENENGREGDDEHAHKKDETKGVIICLAASNETKKKTKKLMNISCWCFFYPSMFIQVSVDVRGRYEQ